MTRLICGCWTADGLCQKLLVLPYADCHCDTLLPRPISPDYRRSDRITRTRQARFAESASLKASQCKKRTPKDGWCDRWCLSGFVHPPTGAAEAPTGALRSISDCGALHDDDLHHLADFRPPPFWRPRERSRWAQLVEEAAEAEAAASDLPASMQAPTIAEINGRLATRDVFTPPSPTGMSTAAGEHLVRVLHSVTPFGWSAPQLSEEQFANRHAWYAHSGFGPSSTAGGLRHAIRALLPNALPPRECDEPAIHTDLAETLENAQLVLTAWGLHSLTLYRGLHFDPDDELLAWEQPLGKMLREAGARGDVRFEQCDSLWHVSGQLVQDALASAADSWACTRDHAESWTRTSPSWNLNCLLVAEVPSWAIFSWGSAGLGDQSHRSEEVVVLGGSGKVLWHIDGYIGAVGDPPPTTPACST